MAQHPLLDGAQQQHPPNVDDNDVIQIKTTKPDWKHSMWQQQMMIINDNVELDAITRQPLTSPYHQHSELCRSILTALTVTVKVIITKSPTATGATIISDDDDDTIIYYRPLLHEPLISIIADYCILQLPYIISLQCFLSRSPLRSTRVIYSSLSSTELAMAYTRGSDHLDFDLRLRVHQSLIGDRCKLWQSDVDTLQTHLGVRNDIPDDLGSGSNGNSSDVKSHVPLKVGAPISEQQYMEFWLRLAHFGNPKFVFQFCNNAIRLDREQQ
jgi:hypothetical protein